MAKLGNKAGNCEKENGWNGIYETLRGEQFIIAITLMKYNELYHLNWNRMEYHYILFQNFSSQFDSKLLEEKKIYHCQPKHYWNF